MTFMLWSKLKHRCDIHAMTFLALAEVIAGEYGLARRLLLKAASVRMGCQERHRDIKKEAAVSDPMSRCQTRQIRRKPNKSAVRANFITNTPGFT